MADCLEDVDAPPAVAPSLTDRTACRLFRVWEAEKFYPWLLTAFPKICEALGLSQKLFDTTKFKGEYDPMLTYALGESISVGDNIYISKIDGNVTSPPSASWVFSPESVRTDAMNQNIDGIKNFLNMPTIAGDLTVESGSNANGNWIKYADGSLIMYGVALLSQKDTYTHIAYALVSYPFVASEIGVATASIDYASTDVSARTLTMQTIFVESWYASIQYSSSSTTDLSSLWGKEVKWHFIGRWK